MKRLITLLVLLIFLTVLPAMAQDPAPSRVQINEVIADEEVDEETGGLSITVYFVVPGEDGRSLPNPPLVEETAQVIVDKEAFPVALEQYTGPSYVVFAVDNSQSMAGHMAVVGNAFLGALERKPPQMSLALRLFRQESDVRQDFTADPLALREAARGLAGTDERDSCLYDAAFAAADSLAPVVEESPQAMRAVVLIGDGINAGRCERLDDRDVDDLIELAQERRISFYNVRFGNIAKPEDIRRLERLVVSTGGATFTFQDEKQLTERLAGILTGLNTQWEARATVFTYTDKEIALNLDLRARGEGNSTTPLSSTSLALALGSHPPREKRLFVDKVNYQERDGLFLVTLRGDNLTGADCGTLKLRDIETNEIDSERSFCWQQGERARLENLPAPDPVVGQKYSIELYSDPLLPEDKAPGEPLDEEEITIGSVPPPLEFDFSVKSVDYEQLELKLIDVIVPDDGQLSYELFIRVDGRLEHSTGPQFLSDPTVPILVDYYPQDEAANQGADVEVEIEVRLRWPNGVVSKQVNTPTLSLRPRAGVLERLTNALSQNPIIPAAILLILAFAILYFVALRRLNRLEPAVVRSPVRGPTQLPAPVSREAGEHESGRAIERGVNETTGDRPRSQAAAFPPPLAARPPLSATLRVLRAPDAARQDEIAVINRFPFRIGREDCELTLGDGRTSRHHASIQQIGDQLVIIDKNSKNGTFLNDAPAPLTPGMRWPLQDGDHIRLGTTIELRLSTHPTGDSSLSGGKPTEP